jgi:hypothetical protein
MTRFNVTVRYGRETYRYHTFEVEAPDVAAALVRAAADLPREVRETGALVELRTSPSPDDRDYLGG